jgi:hypothetical protein
VAAGETRADFTIVSEPLRFPFIIRRVPLPSAPFCLVRRAKRKYKAAKIGYFENAGITEEGIFMYCNNYQTSRTFWTRGMIVLGAVLVLAFSARPAAAAPFAYQPVDEVVCG